MQKGEIILKRENRDFNAGFCVLNQKLPDLIKNLPLLHPNERDYFDKLTFDKRKADYLLGRIASKKAIGELAEEEENMESISIGFGVFQFPVVRSAVNRNIQVSISHCDNIGIALAFPEEHPLGVDIEKMDEHNVNVMRSQVCANEFDLISSSDLCLSTGYTIIWTIKESLSKILRTGLTMDNKLSEIESLTKVDAVYVSTFRHFPQYKAISYYIGNYICSIVLPKNTIPVLDHFWHSFMKIVQE